LHPKGAYQCFKEDQLRLIQHTSMSSTSEALYKDLLLAVQLEVCAIVLVFNLHCTVFDFLNEKSGVGITNSSIIQYY